MKTKKRTINIYSVDFIIPHNGLCYRTISNCTWKEAVELRQQAKILGEKVRIEKYTTYTYEL